jgi:hypothetical protein
VQVTFWEVREEIVQGLESRWEDLPCPLSPACVVRGEASCNPVGRHEWISWSTRAIMLWSSLVHVPDGRQAAERLQVRTRSGRLFVCVDLGELLPDTRAALLRVLQEREFERVGGIEPIRIDVSRDRCHES